MHLYRYTTDNMHYRAYTEPEIDRAWPVHSLPSAHGPPT